MKKTERGVFCIESRSDDDPSFEPTLRLLAEQLDFSILNRAVRRVGTRRDLAREIADWGNRSNLKYPVLWLTGHGSGGRFFVDDTAGNRNVDLQALIEIAEDGEYSWSGCLLHFGAYSTLATHGDECRDLLEKTDLEAISGYSKDVFWIPSLAFEMLYMQFLQRLLAISSSDKGVDQDVLADCRDQIFDSRMCSGLVDHLGFRLITRADFGLRAEGKKT